MVFLEWNETQYRAPLPLYPRARKAKYRQINITPTGAADNTSTEGDCNQFETNVSCEVELYTILKTTK